MAKWDERDPRWLVEHREDGKNVNGWHWEDKNKLEWSRQHLSQLLTSIPAAEEGGLRITKVKEVTGEASVSTRKGGKKLAIYDLKITMQWEAMPLEELQPVKGEIVLEEFCSTNDPDEYIFTYTAEGTGTQQDLFKAVAASMKPHIMEQLEQFVAELGSL